MVDGVFNLLCFQWFDSSLGNFNNKIINLAPKSSAAWAERFNEYGIHISGKSISKRAE